MRIKIKLIITAIALSIIAAFSSYAHQGATGIVKERMETMKSIAQEMKKLKKLLFGTDKADPAQIREAAEALKKHSDITPSLFPKGSQQHPTQASNRIWEDFSAFEREAVNLSNYAQALAISAGGSPAKDGDKNAKPADQKIMDLSKQPPQALFKSMAKTCQTCHQSFREKK